jgi:hypothetical protein
MRKRAKDETRRDPDRTSASAALVTRPPGACAELHVTEIYALVVVPCVKPYPEIAATEQLGESTSMLEDAGVARGLKEMYLAHHGNTLRGRAQQVVGCALSRRVVSFTAGVKRSAGCGPSPLTKMTAAKQGAM